MTTIAEDIQTLGFDAQLEVAGESFALQSGPTFLGIMEVMSEIATQMELGSDVREASRLHVLRTDCPAALLAANANSQVQVLQVDPNQLWKVCARNDNPGDVAVRFTLVKVVTGQGS